MWFLWLIVLTDRVLICVPDSQRRLRGCESKRSRRLRFSADVGRKVVYDAIKSGYRLLDGACDYGNEKEAGDGVRRAIADGFVKREDLCRFSGFPDSNRATDQTYGPV
jgi:diketogulonate reductase-like aldo/keto reductase